MNIDHNFKYHPPTENTAAAHHSIRTRALRLASIIERLLPSTAGREKALALTNCEQAMMWACAGVVRHSANPAPEIPVPANELEELAGVLYSNYCAAVGGKAFNGDALPDWKTFRADPAKQKQSDAWIATAKAAFNQLI